MSERKGPPRSALVFGGTGAVGSAVVRALAAARVPTIFTFNKNEDRAAALAGELEARALQVDLAAPGAVRAAIESICAEDNPPDIFIHAAAVGRAAPLGQLTDDDWQATQAVNCHSAFIAAQLLAPKMAEHGGGHFVFVGALDRTQSAALPAHFAATQGMLSALAMALAKELGPAGILVNLVALGLLETGLGASIRPTLRSDYETFSALRRRGTPEEAARAILWLALENTYMSGKTLPVNGGL